MTAMSPGEKLSRYRAKRHFEQTAEPAGRDASAPAPVADSRRFVIQEHHATRLHWDLRLEHDGVLASWAIPNGIPPDPSENRLAVRTEDHPLEYLEFRRDSKGSVRRGDHVDLGRGHFHHPQVGGQESRGQLP